MFEANISALLAEIDDTSAWPTTRPEFIVN